MLFQALFLAILYLQAFLLGSYITGKLVHSLLIFHQIPAYSSLYTKNTHAANKQKLFPPVLTRLLQCFAEVTSSDATAVPAQRPGAKLVFPSKTSPLKNYYFDFCVPHHAYARVTAWSLKTIPSATQITQVSYIKHANSIHSTVKLISTVVNYNNPAVSNLAPYSEGSRFECHRRNPPP